jgi:hypothetical protein
MKTLPRTRRVFLSKHISGMCVVGKFMKRWKEWDSDRCPRCGSPEDATHVWLCKGPGTEELWSKVVAELEVMMRKLDTDPTLVHIISLYLHSWRTGDAITYEPPREFQALLQAQSAVGWGKFFEGWVVLQWTEQQNRYYKIRVSRAYINLSSRALRHNDRHLVHLYLSALLKKDTNYKVTWLSIAEPALGEGRSEAWRSRTRTDHMVQRMRRCMFSWLRK